VERSFPVILCELRKERGLSQKDAAQALKISQALLSHYEKGIRECSQSFLLKAAEFYEVTCDYLLGRTVAKNVITNAGEAIFSTQSGDSVPSAQTLIKASMAITHSMRNGDKKSGVSVDTLFALELYKILLVQANAGNLPKNWAGAAYKDGTVCCDDTYLGLIDLIAKTTVNPKPSANPDEDAPVPEAIQTLTKYAENYIFAHVEDSLPPLPIGIYK
jgi:transcriptional regulator with XRE-family HTH domain